MQFESNFNRAIALLTGGVIAAATFFYPAPAQADKAKTYKAGAVGLGILGAYLLTKGKTAEGAVAIAGGAYTYKKGRDFDREDNRYSSYPRYDNRGRGDHKYDGHGHESGYNGNDSRNHDSHNYDYGYSYTGNDGQRGNDYGYDSGRGQNNRGDGDRGGYQGQYRQDAPSRGAGQSYDLSPYLR